MALSQAWQAFIYRTTQDINWLTYSSKNDLVPKHENLKAQYGLGLNSYRNTRLKAKNHRPDPDQNFYDFLKSYTVETITDL